MYQLGGGGYFCTNLLSDVIMFINALDDEVTESEVQCIFWLIL